MPLPRYWRRMLALEETHELKWEEAYTIRLMQDFSGVFTVGCRYLSVQEGWYNRSRCS